MVDRQPAEYRPRRAYVEPEPSPDEVSSDDSVDAGQVENGRRGYRPDSAEVDQPRRDTFDDGGIDAGWIDTDDGYGAGDPYGLSSAPDQSQQPSRNGSSRYEDAAAPDYTAPGERDYPHLPPRQSIFADLDEEDKPPPLYRDESLATPPTQPVAEPTPGPAMFRGTLPPRQQPDEDEVAPPLYRTTEPTQPLYRTEPAQPDGPLYREEMPDGGAGEEAGHATWVRPAMSGARGPQARDEESTTLLPRTPTGSRNTRDWQDSIDDFSDIDEDRPRLGRKTKLALLITLVAAVVLVGLAIGYAVLDRPKTSGTVQTPGRPTTSQPSISSAKPTQTQPGVVLTDDSMINAKDAKLVDDSRTWKVALTQRGRTKDSQTSACLGGDPVQGQPTAQLTVLRLLSSGKQSPGILHEADAFTSTQEARQAYAVAAKTLGGCLEVGGYIESGWNVSGLGDQSLGLVVPLVTKTGTQHHTIVLSLTGLVLNVADVAQGGDSVSVSKVAKALAAAINAQCRGAGGACAEPGFLAAGDLPPVKNVSSLWVGNDPDVPSADFLGAQCEKVNWAKEEANERTARTYLLQDGSDPGFGLDEIILTMKDSKTATSFVKDLKSTVVDCPKIKLTATVQKPSAVEGVGAGKTHVSGWTATVSQKSTSRTNKYRIGAVAVGAKVVYTFLSPKGKYDLTDSQWDGVAVRAGERASQVK
jgi:hypothetical protein